MSVGDKESMVSRELVIAAYKNVSDGGKQWPLIEMRGRRYVTTQRRPTASVSHSILLVKKRVLEFLSMDIVTRGNHENYGGL